MSQDRTYTLIQRDQYGQAVNTITGLDELAANTLAAVLRTGDAYDGERPWTCEVVGELTSAEKAQQLAEQWLADKDTNLHTAVELATALELLTTGLRSLGDQHLGDVWMTVDLQVCTSTGDESARRTVVDLLAQVVGTSQSERSGLYGNSDARVRVYTAIAKQKPAPEPQALAEDIPPAQGASTPAVKHRQAEFWKGGDGSGGQCGASCACGTTYDGFDSLAEASALVDKHIAAEAANAEAGPVEPQPDRIPAERVDELLYELNQLTADGGNWWDWIADVPEFDREATASTSDTGELHLVDGTVLRWADKTAWTRATVA